MGTDETVWDERHSGGGDMKRRIFLLGSTAALFAGHIRPRPAHAAIETASVAIVLTDISAQTDATRIKRIAAFCFDKGLWLTCGVRLPESAADAQTQDYMSLLRALGDFGNGLELAVQIPDLALRPAYAQARVAHDAQAQLSQLLGRPAYLQSLICDDQDALDVPTGVRSAGIRNILLRPDTLREASSETWPNGLVRFFGGENLVPAASFRFSKRRPGPENHYIYYLSANTFDQMPEAQLMQWMSAFVDEILDQELAGELALMTAAELQMRGYFEFRKQIAVRLVLPEAALPAQQAHSKAVQAQLAKYGIPSFITSVARSKDTQDAQHFWVPQPPTAGAPPPTKDVTPVTLICETNMPLTLQAKTDLPLGSLISFAPIQSGAFGVDACSILQIPSLSGLNASKQDIRAALIQAGNVVLEIDLSAPPAFLNVENLVKRLASLQQDVATEFVSLDTLAASLSTGSTVEARHRKTLLARTKSIETASGVSQAERAQLLEDAKLAWQYFDKFTNPLTGLCPATVGGTSEGDILRNVTMWDVGSHINALVAATELGFINRKMLERAMDRILPNIAGRRSEDRLLPQGWIRTDRNKWGTRNFDGSDAGRLLSSLDNLRRKFGMEEQLQALVGSWDLPKIIQNGEIHSVTDGVLQSIYVSHSAHYAARAFRRWGLSVSSPYETFDNRTRADGEIALLEAAARIGPIGAEPLLLEAMEQGMSQESAYLAEVLFHAQVEEYAETGRLLCVSETPIDQSPWFIYQGLLLSAEGRRWALDTVGGMPQYQTEAAAEEYLAVSSKAAYLWAAYRPGEFAGRLVRLVREKAKTPFGFASSINIKTQRATELYSDLNTNAVILQAIAYRLKQTG